MEAVIEIRNLRKEFTLVELERLLRLEPRRVFNHVVAVHDVSLTVQRGEVYGFLGPNGAGKTTTLKTCMDLISPTRGTVRIFGGSPRDKAVKARVGYLPEHPYFYDYLKPQEILDFFGRVFGLDGAERKRRIERLLGRVGLEDARNRPLRRFSKGMLQRLGVAQALINQPELLVLDEPLSGLDPMGRKDIRDIIIEERERGTTVLVCSHILSDIEHLCDRVGIIARGRVVKEGTLESLLEAGQRRAEVLARDYDVALHAGFAADGAEITHLGDVYRIVVDRGHLRAVVAAVVGAGGSVDAINPHRDSLEDLFLREAAGR